MKRKMIITAGLFGGSAVILGAMGAHALKEVLDPESLESFKTGVRYQMYHALFLIGLAAILEKINAKSAKWIYGLVVTGTIFFSLSIYLLNMGPVWGVNLRFLGPVTPLGGLMLISSWIVLIFGLKKD